MTIPSVNILFTSVGRRVELLRAFRRAYRDLKVHGHIIAIDVDKLAPALQIADRQYIVPSLDSPEYLEVLMAVCRHERISLIFPLIDPDVSTLAHNRRAIETTGARPVVTSDHATLTALDKLETCQFFKRIGLMAPRSWLPGRFKASRLQYPLFVKPRRGSASGWAYKVNSRRELAFFSKYVPDAIVQECLPGPEFTSDIFADLAGNVLSVVSRRRMQVRSGEVLKGVTVYDGILTEACLRIARELPAVGPINVQCMLKDGDYYFTEINARFGGGAPLSMAAGADYPRWLLAKFAGLEVEVPPIGTYETGMYFTRFDDSFFLSGAEHERVGSCGIRPR